MQDAPIHGDGRWPHGNDDWRDSRRANAVDFTTAWMEMDEDEDDADDDDGGGGGGATDECENDDECEYDSGSSLTTNSTSWMEDSGVDDADAGGDRRRAALVDATISDPAVCWRWRCG